MTEVELLEKVVELLDRLVTVSWLIFIILSAYCGYSLAEKMVKR